MALVCEPIGDMEFLAGKEYVCKPDIVLIGKSFSFYGFDTCRPCSCWLLFYFIFLGHALRSMKGFGLIKS